MSELETPIPEPQEPVAPPEPPADPEPAAPVAEVDADAQIDAEAIEIPTGEKLVPLSAVTKLREELKTVKGAAKEVETLRRQLSETQGNLQAAQPYIDAAKAMLEAQRQPQAQPANEGPSPEERAELEEVAKDFDFYKADGTLDLDKASRHQKRVAATAAKMAEATTQPLVNRTLTQDASTMLARAKNTTLPNGEKADADILEQLWGRIAGQPGGLQTLANVEAAKHLWNQAYALTKVRQSQQPAKTKVEAPPPALFSEKAGGADPKTIALNDGDRRAAKDLGMTEAEYQKEVAKMPAGWGGRR